MQAKTEKVTSGTKPSSSGVGTRLKQLRVQKGFSVADLAQKAGVSVGTISQVERNKANPSVGILERLRHALSVPLSALLEEHHETADGVTQNFVRRANDRPKFGVGSNGMLKELLSPQGQHDLQMMIISLPPGAGSEEVLIGIGEKAGLVIEGTLQLIVGNVKSTLSPGDSFQFKSTVPHSVRNGGTSPVRLLWIMNTEPPVIHL